MPDFGALRNPQLRLLYWLGSIVLGSIVLGNMVLSSIVLGSIAWSSGTWALGATPLLAAEAPATTVCAPTPAKESSPRFATPPSRVVDGDTLEADLNQDGRLQFPKERVRLLYVDTPELRDMPHLPRAKRRDLENGLPAQAFLAQALRLHPWWLSMPQQPPIGFYGRTLAVLHTPAGSVNLALVRAGHSALDTRFGFPVDYAQYVQAEAEAFDAQRGLWGKAHTRRMWLERLRKLGRTPAGASNLWFLRGLQRMETLADPALLEHYVHVRGRVARVRKVSAGVWLIFFRKPGSSTAHVPLPVVLFPHRRRLLPASYWHPGETLRVEGFLLRYRGKPQLQLHYACALAGASASTCRPHCPRG